MLRAGQLELPEDDRIVRLVHFNYPADEIGAPRHRAECGSKQCPLSWRANHAQDQDEAGVNACPRIQLSEVDGIVGDQRKAWLSERFSSCQS
jgi:hypothetical protein